MALRDIHIHVQLTVTEPHDYTEEGQHNFRRVHDSVQHSNTTSHSSSINESSLSISLTDTHVNDQVTVTEPHDYTEEG